MDPKQSTKKLQEYISLYGNKYIAIQQLSKDARRLADEVDESITHSQALSWLISGERSSDISSENGHSKSESYLDKLINFRIEGINKSSIQDSVKKSIELSMMNSNLSYSYEEELNEFDKTRVRVLTRMIWSDIIK